jgi:hypothetical protein
MGRGAQQWAGMRVANNATTKARQKNPAGNFYTRVRVTYLAGNVLARHLQLQVIGTGSCARREGALPVEGWCGAALRETKGKGGEFFAAPSITASPLPTGRIALQPGNP